jgi:hypothetical protein
LVNSNKQLPAEREIPIKKEKSFRKSKKASNKKSIPIIDEDTNIPLLNTNKPNTTTNTNNTTNSVPTIVVSNSNTKIEDDKNSKL